MYYLSNTRCVCYSSKQELPAVVFLLARQFIACNETRVSLAPICLCFLKECLKWVLIVRRGVFHKTRTFLFYFMPVHCCLLLSLPPSPAISLSFPLSFPVWGGVLLYNPGWLPSGSPHQSQPPLYWNYRHGAALGRLCCFLMQFLLFHSLNCLTGLFYLGCEIPMVLVVATTK